MHHLRPVLARLSAGLPAAVSAELSVFAVSNAWMFLSRARAESHGAAGARFSSES